jgi:L-ascorbate metabolism protein UlaG (beta-lactamase superfamily)
MKVTFLGQSGLVLESAGERILIDPYLSDLINDTSNGVWLRAYPVPVPVTEYVGALAVIATHEHADHLDPLTIAPLLVASPATVLVLPEAATAKICWPLPTSQIMTMRGGGESFEFGPFRVTSVPAAHSIDYRLEWSSEHGHRWCGVIIEVEGIRLIHTGDTVDFDGYTDLVGRVDVACVPINGRGREDKDITGNFEPFEAAAFCRTVGAHEALAMHWDMFPVNPGDPAAFVDALKGSGIEVHYGPPMYTLSPG